MVHAGLAVFASFIFLSLDWSILTWISAGIAVASVLLALRMVLLPAPVVFTVTDTGYRASWRAGGRQCRGTWIGLNKVHLSSDRKYLVFEPVAGERQFFWLALVGNQSEELQEAIHQRSNTAHGYRPLN